MFVHCQGRGCGAVGGLKTGGFRPILARKAEDSPVRGLLWAQQGSQVARTLQVDGVTSALDDAETRPRYLFAHPPRQFGESRDELSGDQVDRTAQFPQAVPERGEGASPDRLKAERQRLRRVRGPASQEGIAGR